MIEVEIKLPISEADTIRGKLLGLGFREIGWLQEYDVYFDDARNSVRGPAGTGNQGLPYGTGQRAAEFQREKAGRGHNDPAGTGDRGGGRRYLPEAPAGHRIFSGCARGEKRAANV